MHNLIKIDFAIDR